MRCAALLAASAAALAVHAEAFGLGGFAPAPALRQTRYAKAPDGSYLSLPRDRRVPEAPVGKTRGSRGPGPSMQMGGKGAQGLVTSATIAAAAVNAAVSMKKLEAPDGEAKTYIVKDAARKVSLFTTYIRSIAVPAHPYA